MIAMTPTRATSVLLIEDNPGDARLIREMLRESGVTAFAVESVDRLATALERTNGNRPDAVLLDLGLPDSAGLETYRAVRKAMAATPIVVISGLDDECVALQAMRAGAQDYLVKGRIDGPALARAIRHAIERKHAEQALLGAETRFRALVEQSWDGVVILGADGTIKWCSPATTRLLGYDVNECVGMNAIDLIRPDDHDSARRTLRESANRPREQVVGRARVLHKNGSWRLMEGTFTNLLDEPSVGGIVNNYRDVTDEKAAEDGFRWLSHAVDQGPAAVVMTDEQGNIEYVNHKFTEITGYNLDEALGKNPRILQSGLTPRATYDRLWRTLVARNDFRGEFQNRRKNGEVYSADVLISPVKDQTGKATKYIAIQTDISERKAREAAERETNERFRQLSENIDEIFYVMDAQFRETLYINAAYETVWGRTREGLYDDPASFLTPVLPEDQPKLMENIRRGQRGENPGEVEFRIVRPDGEIRWVVSHAIPIRNQQGEVYRIAGIARDITDRRIALEQLEEAVARYSRFAEATFDGVVITEKGIVLDANAVCAKMLGLESETEAIGQSVLRFVAPESIAQIQDRIAEPVDGTHEVFVTRVDGKKRLLEVAGRSITVDGRPARISALKDITEQRALEEQFRQAQKMEAIGRLAGGVAHDFNNLLTVITGHAEILSMDLPREHPLAESVSQILRAADDAAGLTRQLLAFSRQQVIAPRTIALEQVVTSAHKMLGHLIGEDIQLTTQLAAQPCYVHIDPGQLEQVIVNLVVNARDAMPLGGNLSIETGIVEVPDERAQANWPAMPGQFARLAVTDNGTGMSAETQRRIFEPFFTTKGPGKGTGLGLATVYGIVQQNQGFISVYSEPGIGTTFKIYLPLSNDAPVPDVDRSRFEMPAAGSETVLLVEDATAVRNIARHVLQRHGYQVLESTSPGDAIEMARQHSRIELLLTDVVMPEMSGRLLAEQFAELHPKGKVLFMSGYTDDAIVRNGVLSSEMPYLQKPFTPHGLASKVRHVLDAR